jgi:hypothetical protein
MDKADFAQKIGISPYSLSGMVGQMKNNPKMRRELEDLGYTSQQIPGWVAPSVSSTPLSDAPWLP